MKALKVYNVRTDDFDDEGNVKPDAELLPLYAEQYEYEPGTGTERHGREYIYDNSMNRHPGRHFSVYKDNEFDSSGNPIAIVKNKEVLRRGSSATGYVRGRDKWNNVLYGWSKNDQHTDETDINKWKADWNSKHSRGNYDLQSMYHAANPLSNKIDEREYLSNEMFGGDISYNLLNDVKGVPTVRVPFVIEGDDDDIVSLDDIIDDNYDPGRDFKQEVQFKKIKYRTLPNGIVVPVDDDMMYDLQDQAKDLQILLSDIAYKSNIFYRSIDEVFRKYRGVPELNYTNSLLKDVKNGALKLKEWCSVNKKYLQDIEKLGYFESNGIDNGSGQLTSIINDILKAKITDVDSIREICYSAAFWAEEAEKLSNSLSGSSFFKNANGKILRAGILDTKKWLDDNFNYDDPENISDKHFKTVIRDVSKGIRDKRNTQAAVNVVRRGMF